LYTHPIRYTCSIFSHDLREVLHIHTQRDSTYKTKFTEVAVFHENVQRYQDKLRVLVSCKNVGNGFFCLTIMEKDPTEVLQLEFCCISFFGFLK